MISVVIPTISGREDSLARCVESYCLSSMEVEVIVVRNAPSCGHAWQKGYSQSKGEYVHFTADDIIPFPNWWLGATQMLEIGIVPAATVFAPNGKLAVCDSPLGDMGLHPNVLVPMLTREMLDLGDWLLPIHYGSDDWITYRAVELGMDVRRCPGYDFTHFVANEGRNYKRRYADVKNLVAHMEEHGYVPPVYAQLEINLLSSTTGLDNVSISQLDANARGQLRNQSMPLIRTWK